jgi:hypothetical protein
LKKVITAVLFIAFFFSTIMCMGNVQVGNAQAASQSTFCGWQVADRSAKYTEIKGVITLSGNNQSPGTTLYKEISPKLTLIFRSK